MTQKPPKTTKTTPLKATWTKADAAQRRDLIVDVALDLLASKGIDHVTIRRVASKIGVGAMTLYTYIDGQQGLRTALIDRGFEEMGSQCDKESRLQNDWLAGCNAYLNFARNNPNLYNLMFAHPVEQQDLDQIHSHFNAWRDEMREDYTKQGYPEDQILDIVENTSRNMWIALHGFASLLISKRIPWDEQQNELVVQRIVAALCPDTFPPLPSDS